MLRGVALEGGVTTILIGVIGVAAMIFAATCYYASWEDRIDRRQRERAEAREAWDLLTADWRLPLPPNRGREYAG